MAKKNLPADKTDAKQAKGKKKKGGSALKTFLVVVVIIVTLGVIGALAFIWYLDPDRYRQAEMPSIRLNEDIRKYTFENLRDIYDILVKINSEIAVIDKEIERLDSIESEYPDQKKIPLSEKKQWDKTKKSLEKTLAKNEKVIEMLYVAYKVDNEKGRALADEKKRDLEGALKAPLTESLDLTEKLKPKEEETGFTARIKKLFTPESR